MYFYDILCHILQILHNKAVTITENSPFRYKNILQNQMKPDETKLNSRLLMY